jgi:citrate synthase
MNKYYKKLAKLAITENPISKEMYEKYNVKHGLRNKDGSGVVVGLTDISTVIGYQKDGEELWPIEGDLKYRGISIFDIIDGIEKDQNKDAFAETTYLLMFGVLPNRKELQDFVDTLREMAVLPKDFAQSILGTYRTRKIMNLISRSILTLYSLDPDADNTSPENLVWQGMNIIAKLPTIVAYSYRVIRYWWDDQNLVLRKVRKRYNSAENFLRQLKNDSKFTDLEAHVLNLSLVLHAEHGGGNNSTFTTRVVSSSGTDTYSAIAAAIGSLKGPLHGGANERVVGMMDEIKKNVGAGASEMKMEAYLEKVITKKAYDKSGKVYGFGHPVYTISDPRVKIFKKYAKQLAEQKGVEAEYQLYEQVENLMPQVFARVKKNNKRICANVDFYSGFVYECMNLPREIFTPLFAMARVSGWIAHRTEEVLVSRRIIRPAYKNVIQPRDYMSIAERE